MKPIVSIIIVNYNGKDLTLNCLRSIYEKLKGVEYEVILVDNASSDDSVEVIEKSYPQVSIIKNDDNLGFSKANNQGIKIAKRDYVLLLNNDTLLQGGNFNEFIPYMEANRDVGILGCRINNPDGSLQVSCYKFPSMWEMFTHYTFLTRLFPDSKLFGDYRNWSHTEIKEVDFVIGAFFLIKRAVIKEVGLLDEDFFLNAEESEYCLRAKKAGYKTVFHPGYEIIHIGGATKKGMKKRDIISHIRGTNLLIKKHHGWVYFVTYKLLSFLLSLVRFIIFGITLLLSENPDVKDKFVQSKYLILHQVGLFR
ncbi:MAG: glycosyltransferase family 2 protein [Candidatus Omnitrophica bacterium]|nr:glycosyltransferase family 2 protein [Candidatus Omnitrophota bacterium]